MSERILVRGELSNWVHAGRVSGTVASVIGLVVGLAAATWGWAVAIGGGILWLILEFVAWKARRVRTWLTLHPDGIEVEGPASHRAVHDSQVSAVALQTKKNLNNGEFSSVTRKFTIWAEDWPDPILMENKIKLGKTDPLAELIQRLLDRLRTRMEQELARGGTASGDGWHLSRAALTLGRSPQEEQLPLSEIAAIEQSEGQMCVWRRGVDAAVAKLPLSGRNVHLLPALVKPFLSNISEARTGPGSDAGLGRVLFERRSNRSTILVLGIVSMGLIAVAAALVIAYQSKQADEGALVGGTLMLPIGFLIGLLGVWLAFTAFRCHEHGVWRATLLGQRSLRYADVARFQYSAVRHYHHGAYVGTQLTMRFVPLASLRAKPLKYTARIVGEDDDLDRLRDSVSQIIAARMAEQFQAGQTVSWTSNLEFTPEGIRYRAQKWFIRQPGQLLPYEDYVAYELKGAVFYLFARGNKKHLMTEQATAENFYPGFFLLQMLMHQSVMDETATEPAAAD